MLSISVKQISRWRWIQRRQAKSVCACGDRSPLAVLWLCGKSLLSFLLQHPGYSGEAAGEYCLEGNHVTFKTGTFLDNLSMYESRVNVINPLLNTSGSLWNLCGNIVIIFLTMRRQIFRIHFTFFRRPLDILSRVPSQKTWLEMAGNCGGNCHSIFDCLMLHCETLIFIYYNLHENKSKV